MFYDHTVNQIVELVKNAPNETDARVEAHRIIREMVADLAHAAEAVILHGLDEGDDNIEDLKIGGTD